MDLIYTDQGRTELGVIQNFNVDFDTTGNMDFQLTVGIQNNLLQGGFYWYIEGTEYGGRVDSYKVLTASNEIQYTGRNFRGILNTKVIEPPSGEDYKILSGTMTEVASTLISDAGLEDLFVVDECDVAVSNHKFNRYVKTYAGLEALCVAYGLVPSFKVQDGMVHIAFDVATDYSDENEYTQDDLSFTITKTYANVNHLICLGKGDLKDRTVCHLYADSDGNISETQTLFGQDEITEIYENTNAEDLAELKQEGITRLSELKNKDSFEVTASNLDLKIGDIIGGIERVTNTYVAREIVNIIAKIDDYKVDLEYKVGEDEAKRSSSFGASSGGGTSTYILPVATTEVLGGVKQGENVTIEEDGTITVTVDSALSDTSTKPVQNKVVNDALASKANASHTHTSLVSGNFRADMQTDGNFVIYDNNNPTFDSISTFQKLQWTQVHLNTSSITPYRSSAYKKNQMVHLYMGFVGNGNSLPAKTKHLIGQLINEADCPITDIYCHADMLGPGDEIIYGVATILITTTGEIYIKSAELDANAYYTTFDIVYISQA